MLDFQDTYLPEIDDAMCSFWKGLPGHERAPSLGHAGSFPCSTVSFTYSSDDKNVRTDTFQGNEQLKMLPV